MTEANQMLLFEVAAIVLPMVPAFVLFKFLPASSEVSGLLQGMQVKFGGAFAGYLVLFLTLWYGKPVDTHHYHYWTVKGMVQADRAGDENAPSLRDVVCRIVPPRFEVENDGSFAFEIAMPEDDQGATVFPDLQINLPNYAGATVHLNDGKQGYGSVAVKQDVDTKRRIITLGSPIVLSSVRTQTPYVPATAERPTPANAIQ